MTNLVQGGAVVYSLVQAVGGFYIAFYLVRTTRELSTKLVLQASIDVLWGLAAGLCCAALLTRRLEPWMLYAWGGTYLLMVPVPCYFRVFRATGAGRAVRNLFMCAVAMTLLLLASL